MRALIPRLTVSTRGPLVVQTPKRRAFLQLTALTAPAPEPFESALTLRSQDRQLPPPAETAEGEGMSGERCGLAAPRSPQNPQLRLSESVQPLHSGADRAIRGL